MNGLTDLLIADNTISSNQWGGVDIRRSSCPMVCRNTITNGLGDGIVIGDQGQGTIENNIISGQNTASVLAIMPHRFWSQYQIIFSHNTTSFAVRIPHHFWSEYHVSFGRNAPSFLVIISDYFQSQYHIINLQSDILSGQSTTSFLVRILDHF